MGWKRNVETIKIRIKASDINVSTGHKEHFSGTGPHNPKPRKNRTRRDEKRNAIRESEQE